MSRLVGLVLGVSLKDQAVFFRQLAAMISAGLPTAKALATLRPQVRGPLGDAIADMARTVEAGLPMSRSLEKRPELFSPFLVAMVRAGEVSGTSDERLTDLADFLEESHTVQQSLMSQLLYPLLILHAAIFLPTLPVLVLQGVGAYLIAIIPGVVTLYGLMATLFVMSRLGYVVPGARAVLDQLSLMVPIIGRVVRRAAVMRFLRALGDLLEAGIPNGEALAVASSACGNLIIGRRFASAGPMLDMGTPLTQVLAASRVLDPAALQMIATGEASGNVGMMMRKTADYLQVEYREAVKRAMAVMPVVLMLLVGVAVGYQYITMLSGIFGQLNDVMPR